MVDDDEFAEFDFDDDLCLAAIEQVEKVHTGHHVTPNPPRPKSDGTLSSRNAQQGNGNTSFSKSPLNQEKTKSVKEPKLYPLFEICSGVRRESSSRVRPLQEEKKTSETEVANGFQHEYDAEAVKRWVYPTNYSLREYQFNICRRALFHNTLVSLPTGLGKTLIAAVVMLNYQRWFPSGKLIFMAPTRPLVRQQMKSFIGYFEEDTVVELTGHQQPEKRRALWHQKRVFFITPQVFQNDLEQNFGADIARQVVLLCVDEAHRATGNHAYCTVVRGLHKHSATYRILALSATPGSDLQGVQSVITNLNISHIEARTEASMDIIPYTHTRSTQIIEIPPSKDILHIKALFSAIITHFLKRLCSFKVFTTTDPDRTVPFLLLQARDRSRTNQSRDPSGKNLIESDFAIAITLCHAYALLLQHGIVTFNSTLNSFIAEAKTGRMSPSKAEFLRRPELADILAYVDKITKNPLFVSHPKVEKLVAVVLEHLTTHEDLQRNKPKSEQEQTRIMIFSEYRESVEEIVAVLQQHYPLVRVMQFVGQATKKGGNKGYSQKEQMRVGFYILLTYTRYLNIMSRLSPIFKVETTMSWSQLALEKKDSISGK
jgi:Fanconi anemia group M protein